jgi:hypothetical protein
LVGLNDVEKSYCFAGTQKGEGGFIFKINHLQKPRAALSRVRDVF